MQAMSSMLEAIQRNLKEEAESRKAEASARAAAQERCSAADERVTKLEWESAQANATLQRKASCCAHHPALSALTVYIAGGLIMYARDNLCLLLIPDWQPAVIALRSGASSSRAKFCRFAKGRTCCHVSTNAKCA